MSCEYCYEDVEEALRTLDAINSSGRLDYGDYCDLHDAISSIKIPEPHEIPSVQPEQRKTLELPNIYVAKDCDIVESEDGRAGFGVYIPSEKQIYVAGDVPNEVFIKTLFHELIHWVQDETGNEFSEDVANKFAEKVYESLPSTQPEQRWIPVSERLPEDMAYVLITIWTAVHTAYYHNNHFFTRDSVWAVGEKGLLAWMYQPEPYKEGENEKSV